MTLEAFRNIDSDKIPSAGKIEIEREVIDDPYFDPLDYLFQDEAYREQDQARLDAFQSGEWHGVGVRAMATVYIPVGQGSFAIYTLTSPGLWGIESDSGEDYFDEVFAEEKSALIDSMVKIGALAKMESAS